MMKRCACLIAIPLVFQATIFLGTTLRAEARERAESHVLFLVGNSTLDEQGGDESQYASWGASLREFLRPGMKIVNHAKRGCSIDSYLADGRWRQVLAAVRPGDFVLVQFGCDDQKTSKTDGAAPVQRIQKILLRMAGDVRKCRATPILATPLVRLDYRDGRLCDRCRLEELSKGVRRVSDDADVALVDMHELTRHAVESAGEPEARTWYASGDAVRPAVPGARIYARLFQREVWARGLEVSRMFMGPAPNVLTLRPGGSVRLPDDPEGFIPTLEMDGTSLTAIGRTAATEKGVDYDFVKKGVAWAHGFARLEKTVDGARVTWEFVLKRPAKRVKAGTICSLDVGRFPPQSFDLRETGRLRIRELFATFPGDCRAQCLDGRWKHPFHSAYNVKVRAPEKRDVSEGEKLAFTMDFASKRPLGVAFAGPVVADETSGWVPMKHLKNIRPGSALDFSGFGLQDAPAGKYGWLKMADNRLYFENRPDFSPRFSGVNFCNDANYPETADEAEYRAERLRLLGYNTLRIHHHDNYFAYYENGKLVLNTQNADRLDRLVDACIRRGIYFTTDLYVSRQVTWKDIGVERPGSVPVKVWQMVTERGWRDWCDYARLFMGHRNPYTGRKYAEEPAMPFVCIQNETANGDFTLFPEQKELWGEFLRETRAKVPGAFPGYSSDKLPSNGLWWDAGAETAVKSAFWAFLERRFIGRAVEFLRKELGVKAFLAGDNFGPTPAFVQEMHSDVYGYSDAHLYATGWWEWLGKGQGHARPMKMKHLNPLQKGTLAPESYAFRRVWGQPFCISEWDYIGPDSHRSVGGLIFGTVAARQGWNAVWHFTYDSRGSNFADNHGEPELFNMARDPLKLAGDRATTLLFLRGDMPAAPASIALDFGNRALDPTLPHTYKSDPSWANSGVVFSHRVGVSVRGRGVSKDAQTFSQDAVNGLQEPPLEVSMPGEVALDRIRGTLAVATPRTIGVYTPEFGSYAVGGSCIRTSGEAMVFVSALNGKDIASAARILVTHLTDALGRGVVYMDDAAHIQLETAKLETVNGETLAPIVLRNGTAELALKLDRPEAYVVYALETDGRRAARVATSVCNGRLVFGLSVSQPFGGCLHYEVVRE